jgi:2'-5' RNA ligase
MEASYDARMPAESEHGERLFLGVPVTARARDDLVKRLPKSVPGKMVPPENWHLTLRFLGQTALEQRDHLVGALRNTTFPPPFRIAFTGVGAFPRTRRAKVLWIGIDTGAETLVELAALVERAVASAGFTPESRPFHPHLTIARLDPAMNVRRVVTPRWQEPVLMQVSAVSLFRSQLGRGPARYDVVEHFALGD